MRFTIIRFISITTMVLLFLNSRILPYSELFICLTLSHYVLAYFYSRRTLKKILLRSHRNKIAFYVFLALVLVSMYYQWPSFNGIFGIHFALTEAYLWSRSLEKEKFHEVMAIRFFMHLFFYYIISNQVGIYLGIYTGGFFILLLALGYRLYVDRLKWNKEILQDLVVYELMTTVMIILSLGFNFKTNLIGIIFYHVIFWLFIPFGSPENRTKKFFFKFTCDNLVIIIPTLIISFYTSHSLIVNYNVITRFIATSFKIHNKFIFILLIGYFHVIMMPFMSDKNPKFLNDIIGHNK